MWVRRRRFVCTRVGLRGEAARISVFLEAVSREVEHRTPQLPCGAPHGGLHAVKNALAFQGYARPAFVGVSHARGIIGGFSRNSVARPHPKQQPI